jgi:hypothetical protein
MLRGKKLQHLHVQACGTMYFVKDTESITWLNKKFNEILKERLIKIISNQCIIYK